MVIGKIKLAPNNVAWYDDKTRIVLNRKQPVHDVHDYHDMRNIKAGVRAKLIIFIPAPEQEPVKPEQEPVKIEEPKAVEIQPVMDLVEVVEEKVEEPEEKPAPKKRRKKKQEEGAENE